MSAYLIRRLIQAALLLLGVSIIVFGILRMAPGDPATMLVDPSFFTPEELRELRESLGLEAPLPTQYLKTMTGMFEGSLRSFRTQQSTADMVREALPTTALVVFSGVLLALLVGIPFGVLAARRPNGIIDRLLSLGIVSAISFPVFVLAMLMIRVFAEELHVLPGSGIRPFGVTGYPLGEILPHLILPAIATAFPIGAIISRYTRDAVYETLNEDYVRTAYAKGLPGETVMVKHVLRNALVTLVSVLGIIIPLLLGGSVIIESLFNLPGIGRITVDAAIQRDYPVVMTTTMVSALLVVLGNLLADLFYGVVDPRIRVG